MRLNHSTEQDSIPAQTHYIGEKVVLSDGSQAVVQGMLYRRWGTLYVLQPRGFDHVFLLSDTYFRSQADVDASEADAIFRQAGIAYALDAKDHATFDRYVKGP